LEGGGCEKTQEEVNGWVDAAAERNVGRRGGKNGQGKEKISKNERIVRAGERGNWETIWPEHKRGGKRRLEGKKLQYGTTWPSDE